MKIRILRLRSVQLFTVCLLAVGLTLALTRAAAAQGPASGLLPSHAPPAPSDGGRGTMRDPRMPVNNEWPTTNAFVRQR